MSRKPPEIKADQEVARRNFPSAEIQAFTFSATVEKSKRCARFLQLALHFEDDSDPCRKQPKSLLVLAMAVPKFKTIHLLLNVSLRRTTGNVCVPFANEAQISAR